MTQKVNIRSQIKNKYILNYSSFIKKLIIFINY